MTITGEEGGAYRFPAARVLAAVSAAAATWNDTKTTAMHSVKLILFAFGLIESD